MMTTTRTTTMDDTQLNEPLLQTSDGSDRTNGDPIGSVNNENDFKSIDKEEEDDEEAGLRFDERQERSDIIDAATASSSSTEIRVVVNPSMLQRLLLGNSTKIEYYFFDDIASPSYEELKLWNEDQKLRKHHRRRQQQQQQQQALMKIVLEEEDEEEKGQDLSSSNIEDDGSDSSTQNSFNQCWIRFCVRLNDIQNELYHQRRQSMWALVVGWLLMNVILVKMLVSKYSSSFVWDLPTNVIDGIMPTVTTMMVLNITPLLLPPLTIMKNQQDVLVNLIQHVVDDMTNDFLQVGYHIDFVIEGKYPFLSSFLLLGPSLYIRFSPVSTPNHNIKDDAATIQHLPNVQQLYDIQHQALIDYQDWLILKQREKEEEDKTSKSQSSNEKHYDNQVLFGIIRLKTLQAWKPVIMAMTYGFGITYFLSVFMIFVPF